MTRLLLLTALLASAALAPLALAQPMPITTSSDVARAEFVLGRARTGHVDNAGAIAHLDRAIAADPTFALAHLYRAIASGPGRDEHMRFAAAGNASDAERQMVESYAAHLRDDHDRERAILRTLTTRFPADPNGWLTLANVEQSKGDGAAAAAAARRSIAADASFAPAYNTLGYALVSTGDMAGAESAFRDYIRLAPDEANPYDSYGEFLLTAGRFDDAQAQYEIALAKNPTYEGRPGTGLALVGVTRASAAYIVAANRHDLEAYLGSYIPTAVMSPPSGTEIVGHDAIRAAAAPYFAAPGQLSITSETQEIVPMGNGFAWQRSAVTTTAPDGTRTAGTNAFIWVETPDGWKIARDIWTSAPVAD